jgi:SAM-dependent methyltransferase
MNDPKIDTSSTPEDPGLTPQVISAAYRLLLDREPEDEQVTKRALGYGTRAQLLQAILSSNEFRRRNPLITRLNNLPLELPRLDIDADLAGPDRDRLFEHIKAKWTSLGEAKPHWSVLSNPLFAGEITPEVEQRFYGTGAVELKEVQALLDRAGRSTDEFADMVEYGCGLGRMTLQFGRIIPRVTGLDISTAHLRLARDMAERMGAANVAFETADLPDFGMRDPFDFWYSRIVLQHNPPPLIKAILRRALERLRPGGVAIFQVPTHSVNYSFGLEAYIGSRDGAGDIEMHCLPQRDVLDVVAETGCRPCEIREDRSVNIPQYWISNTFVVEKPPAERR